MKAGQERAGQIGGVVGWLMAKLRGTQRGEPRLALVERIALAPKQSLALVEAEGRRILVATSAEGGPAFYAFDEKSGWNPAQQRNVRGSIRRAPRRQSRVSW